MDLQYLLQDTRPQRLNCKINYLGYMCTDCALLGASHTV